MMSRGSCAYTIVRRSSSVVRKRRTGNATCTRSASTHRVLPGLRRSRLKDQPLYMKQSVMSVVGSFDGRRTEEMSELHLLAGCRWSCLWAAAGRGQHDSTHHHLPVRWPRWACRRVALVFSFQPQ
jgi:hypothetical protein